MAASYGCAAQEQIALYWCVLKMKSVLVFVSTWVWHQPARFLGFLLWSLAAVCFREYSGLKRVYLIWHMTNCFCWRVLQAQSVSWQLWLCGHWRSWGRRACPPPPLRKRQRRERCFSPPPIPASFLPVVKLCYLHRLLMLLMCWVFLQMLVVFLVALWCAGQKRRACVSGTGPSCH